jgi:hypothetical protein
VTLLLPFYEKNAEGQVSGLPLVELVVLNALLRLQHCRWGGKGVENPGGFAGLCRDGVAGCEQRERRWPFAVCLRGTSGHRNSPGARQGQLETRDELGARSSERRAGLVAVAIADAIIHCVSKI